jgi:hypothetical protein
VADFRASNPRNWWQSVEQFIGLSASGDLRELSGNLFRGNTCKIVHDINVVVTSVAADLPPLQKEVVASLADDCADYFTVEVAEVERWLSDMCVNKSPGLDYLSNWYITNMTPFQTGPICAVVNVSVIRARVPAI